MLAGPRWVGCTVCVPQELLIASDCSSAARGEVMIALRAPEVLTGGRGSFGSKLVWVQCEKCLEKELELLDSSQVSLGKRWLWCAAQWACPRLDVCMGWQSWIPKVLREATSVG